MSVAIIKYNAGNIFSVLCAMHRLGVEPIITDEADELFAADKVIFPGVGEASSAMKYLRDKQLDDVICNLKQPTLGICIGQQLMCKHSEEGNVDCLGIFNANVLRFQTNGNEKVPHMGWNTISEIYNNDIITSDILNKYVYYVHSYYVPVCDHTIAKSEYILPYSAAMHKDNFYSTQFHPEKSGSIGEQILKNFLNL